jgi:hypothetical protein
VGTTRTKKTIEKSPVEGLTEALKTQFPGAFEPELVGNVDVQEAAKDVLLSIAYTPVVPNHHGIVPCSVVALDPENTEGKYRVYFPAHFDDHRAGTTQDVTADELREMRARYLLTMNYLRSFFDRLSYNVQQMALRLYFDSKAPWTPLPGSRLANIPAEGLSIKLKPGQTHAELMAEMFTEAGAEPGDVRVVTMGDDPVETARRLGFPVPTKEHQDARSRLLGVLGARAGLMQEAQITRESDTCTKPAGHPLKKKRGTKNQQDTLPIAEAYYSVVQLPPATAQSPNPALRAADGMLRAVFAVWYTSHRPDLAELDGPDELGCYVGAQCGVEAQTAADRLIRQHKGPRSFAWPLSPEFATRVYTDGIRQRTTSLQMTGRKAMLELGFLDEPKIHSCLTDKDVQHAYRRIISERRLHPDQGGDRDAFELVTLARDSALEYVRSLGEAHGRAGQDNEEREVSTTLGPRAREFLVQWVKDQRGKDLAKKPHLTVAANPSMLSVLRILVKRGFARIAQEGEDKQSHFYALTPEGMQEAADIEKKASDKVGNAKKVAVA